MIIGTLDKRRWWQDSIPTSLRVYSTKGTSPTITQPFGGGHIHYIIDNRGKTMNSKNIRKLTPSETLRLMDMDEENIQKIVGAKDEKGRQLISNTRIYAAAGNGIVTACLEGIFHNLFIK